jgi:hypothetical protein
LQLTAAAPNLTIVKAGTDAPDELDPFFEEVNYTQLRHDFVKKKESDFSPTWQTC